MFLCEQQRRGAISDLRRQVPYKLMVNDKLVCKYVADHVYVENGETVVEDVKSEFMSKNPVFRIKKKLMAACLGIEIREFIQ